MWERSYGTFDLQEATEKQSQFPPLCRSGDRRSQGPIVRNKPNSAESDLEDKCRADKELRRIACGKGLGKTKPISRGRQGPGPKGVRTAGGDSCTTKANFRHAADREIGGPRGPTVPNKPNLPGAISVVSVASTKDYEDSDGNGRMEEQSQFGRASAFKARGSEDRHLPPCLRAFAQNKPNSRLWPIRRSAVPGANRAKQSQFEKDRSDPRKRGTPNGAGVHKNGPARSD